MTSTADFSQRFTDLIADMKMDGRYRTFIQLERLAGEFPTALWHRPDGQSRLVTVWCSNDYLGMGQHPAVGLADGVEGIRVTTVGFGGRCGTRVSGKDNSDGWGEGLWVFPLMLLYTAISYRVFRGKLGSMHGHY